MENTRVYARRDKEHDRMENGKCEWCERELNYEYSVSVVFNHPNYSRAIREFCCEMYLRDFYRNNEED